MANYVFTPAKTLLAAGGLNWQTDGTKNFYVALFAQGWNSYISSAGAHTSASRMADLASAATYQFNGTGYPTGGFVMSTGSRALSANGNLAVLDLTDIVATLGQGSSTGTQLGDTIRDIIIYQGTAGGASSTAGLPVAHLELQTSYQGQGASFTIQWAANGAMQIA